MMPSISWIPSEPPTTGSTTELLGDNTVETGQIYFMLSQYYSYLRLEIDLDRLSPDGRTTSATNVSVNGLTILEDGQRHLA